MSEGSDLLSRVRIASPCTAGWEAMEGDERARFCRLCSLHVYNLSEMTRAEAEALIARTEGRLCGRLYRRADGTVLTKDCPTGLRAVRQRVTRRAGAALAAVLGLCALALGQEKGKAAESCDTGAARVLRAAKQAGAAALKGVVLDPAAGGIPGARVVFTDKAEGRKYEATASAEGAFEFASLPPGAYLVEVSAPYFKSLTMTHLAVGGDESVRLELTLNLDVEILSGIVSIDLPPEKLRNGNGVTVFNSKEITSLPPP